MRAIALIMGLICLSGCRHAPPAIADVGASSFVVVEPPRPPAPPSEGTVTEATPTGAEYRYASFPRKPVLPVYPARALAARAGEAQVGVRVSIDTQGRVSSVSTSMFIVSITPPGFSEDFYQAVETAVRQWKFQPARIEYVETVTEGGTTYHRVKRSEPLETQLDLAFTFTASGGVQAGAGK